MGKQKEPDNRKPIERSQAQLKFMDERKDYTDKEMQMELLMTQKNILEQLRKNRHNTSALVNFMSFYLILGILIGLAIMAGLA